MARLVKRLRGKPYAVTIGGETKYICGCGLSSTQPFCNGTHKITQTEVPGMLYWYDGEQHRYDATDNYSGICSDEQTKDK